MKYGLAFFLIFLFITGVSAEPEITNIEELPLQGETIENYDIRELENGDKKDLIEPHTLYQGIEADLQELEGQINVHMKIDDDFLNETDSNLRDLLVVRGENLKLSGVYRNESSFAAVVDEPGKYYVIVPDSTHSIDAYENEEGECNRYLNPPETFEKVDSCNSSSFLPTYLIPLLTIISVLSAVLYNSIPLLRRKYFIYKISKTTDKIKNSGHANQQMLQELAEANQYALTKKYKKANEKLREIQKQI